MYRDHTIGVVVPAYNEEGFVGEVVETVPSYVDRVYVVDDGSTDDTWAEIQAAAERVNERAGDPDTNGTHAFEKRVVPIQHDENRGVGGAIKTGYLRAREDRIDVTAVMGGDGQMRPDKLRTFLDPIIDGEADYAKGDRLYDPAWYAEMPRHRLIGNHVLSLLTRIASGYWELSDPQNGYTAISLDALETVPIEDMYEFYGYCNDLLVKLHVHGCRVADVPREPNYADEESHITYSTYVPRVSGMLLRNFLWRLREEYADGDRRAPGACYGAGALLGLVGTALPLASLADGDRSPGLGAALATVLAGGLVFLLGAVLERNSGESLAFTIDPAEAELGDEDAGEPAVDRAAQAEADAD